MRAAVVVFVVAAAACVVAHVAIIASVVRRTTKAEATGVPRPRFALELLWALLPALALAFLLSATWSRVRDHTYGPQEVLKVAQ
jgi:heme/copper-type cytochrome/quinol oxidase subunit 2